MKPGFRRAAPGRLPERVYWFRRAFVLIGLALVIALLMWLVSLLGGGPKTAAPSITRTTAPADSGTPSAPDSLQATGLPAPAETPSATATVQPTTALQTTGPPAAQCDPGLLSLSITGPGQVKVGATAAITVTVTNSDSTTCSFTFDNRFTLKIVSGADEIWSTADCAQWAPSGTQTLAPGAAATWQATWDRHRSQATCKLVPTALKAGTYVANALYAGAGSAQLVMLLTA
jgi:hypothetical protein